MQKRTLKSTDRIEYADILEMAIVLKVKSVHLNILKCSQTLHQPAEGDNNALSYIKTDVTFSILE